VGGIRSAAGLRACTNVFIGFAFRSASLVMRCDVISSLSKYRTIATTERISTTTKSDLPSFMRIFIHHKMVAVKNEKLEKSKKT